LKGVRLTQWIESRVTRQGGSISRQAAGTLMEAIGGDLHTMANEINKLTAYTGGRRIEENDVRMVVSASQEADIFAMIEAVMDDKAGTAEQILQKLLQNGVAPQHPVRVSPAQLPNQVPLLFNPWLKNWQTLL